jgi:4,5-DOPA dioxygenase extradiol
MSETPIAGAVTATASATAEDAGSTAHRMPALFMSHGGPTLGENATWSAELAQWGRDLPRPKAILILSAHWEEAPLAIGATTVKPLIYDFWGFPDEYYRLRYPAPGAPELAEQVRKLLRAPGMPVQDLPDRGLDHGTYVPLLEMYPKADVPVLQVSLPTLDPRQLLEIGRKLAPLRDEGYLIVGSGSFTHNLRALNPTHEAPAPLAEFDAWGKAALVAGDVDAILDFKHKAPAARFAHPREEHFVPLAVTLGTALDELDAPKQVIEGTWMGLSKRSVQYG